MKLKRQFKDDLAVLKDERYVNPILPETRKQLARKVHLSGEVRVEGGVWCKSLDIEAGPVQLDKSVFAEVSIVSKSVGDQSIYCKGIISSGENVNFSDPAEKTVLSSICSKTVNLNNSLVVGNVYSERCVIDNTIVLGSIRCKNLTITNSIIGSFKCENVVVKGNLGIVFPYMLSKNIDTTESRLFMIYDLGAGKELSVFELDASKSVKSVKLDDSVTKMVISPIDGIFDLENFKNSMERSLHEITKLVMGLQAGIEDTTELEALKDILFKLIRTGFEIETPVPRSEFMSVDHSNLDPIVSQEILLS